MRHYNEIPQDFRNTKKESFTKTYADVNRSQNYIAGVILANFGYLRFVLKLNFSI